MRTVLVLLLIGTLSACESTYYGAMEKVGVHKRDILVDRVDEAKEAQGEAQVEFQDALSQFRAVVDFKGGDLEALYDRLNGEYQDSVKAAETIRERIDKVESVAEALFEEWEEELELYSNPRLREESKSKLAETSLPQPDKQHGQGGEKHAAGTRCPTGQCALPKTQSQRLRHRRPER